MATAAFSIASCGSDSDKNNTEEALPAKPTFDKNNPIQSEKAVIEDLNDEEKKGFVKDSS